MHIGLAAHHGGFDLKEELAKVLRAAGREVVVFGAPAHTDRPRTTTEITSYLWHGGVANGEVERGAAICGVGVEASIAGDKTPGIRAGLVHGASAARLGVVDDEMSFLCLGSRVIGVELVEELVRIFREASFTGHERHRRRMANVTLLERE